MTTGNRFAKVAKGPFDKRMLYTATRYYVEIHGGSEQDAEDVLAKLYAEHMAGERKLPPDDCAALADYVLSYHTYAIYVALLAKAHRQL